MPSYLVVCQLECRLLRHELDMAWCNAVEVCCKRKATAVSELWGKNEEASVVLLKCSLHCKKYGQVFKAVNSESTCENHLEMSRAGWYSPEWKAFD